ncbi:DNA-processing protein DprA [Marinivivus vitaminiproducens]|uniref:DNA-processing protein DprA n=1 Tax=Marinivivus vitaminiproducens TaxID=3035935 RepID=UPI0027A7E5C9|nr:DNA-processing protein DprA [Geminicoccaceae bacterium SCSIO 64248]
MNAVPDDAERLAWLRLARSDGVGPILFERLLTRYGSARAALRALPDLAASQSGARRLRAAEARAVEREAADMARLGWPWLLRTDASYPDALAAIADPPPVLGVRGDATVLARPCIALIGARNASANGGVFARRLASDLAATGYVIVSGLARGIDTAVHAGALEAGGITVAAIASGLDVAYPLENADLTERIARSGAVISERPLGAEPKARHFPKRNRIIAGLSLGVVVIEAAPASGSLITARLALEQGREVLAVPGSPMDERHRGTNQLLRDGAHLVENAADVLAVIAPLAQRADRTVLPARASAAVRRTSAVHARGAPAPTAVMAEAEMPDGLSGALLRLLGPEPLAVDELVRQVAAGAAEVQEALAELELDDRIARHPGNRVSRAQA